MRKILTVSKEMQSEVEYKYGEMIFRIIDLKDGNIQVIIKDRYI